MNLLSRSTLFRLLKFGTVGLFGVFVNLGSLLVLKVYLREISLPVIDDPLFLHKVLAVEISVLTNFIMNYFWTWGEFRKNLSIFFSRMIKYHGSTFISSFVITLGIGRLILQFMPEFSCQLSPGGISILSIDQHLTSHLIGIMVGMLSNFFLSDRWVFSSKSVDNKPLRDKNKK